MRLFLFLFFLAAVTGAACQDRYYMVVGTYTRGKSTGIYVYDFEPKTGSARIVDSFQTPNPSYLAVAPNQKFVYAVSEVMRGNYSGKVRAFSIDQGNGSLHLINEQPSAGDNPCYLSTDKTGRWLAVGNYSSGSFAILPVRNDGSLAEAVTTYRHWGRGIHAQRQEASHVHSTVFSPDNSSLIVQDLGTDKLMVYAFDVTNGRALPKDSIRVHDGAGPRHFEFHPSGKWAYLVEELSGNVTTFSYKKGSLRKIQTVSTLPPGFNQSFTSADIHVSKDGKFLYASTRDALNTLAIFRVQKRTGKLNLIGHQSTLGKTPRHFNFDPSGNYLLVANQNSDHIVIFKIDHQTGKLNDTGNRIDVGSPVCIKWVAR